MAAAVNLLIFMGQKLRRRICHIIKIPELMSVVVALWATPKKMAILFTFQAELLRKRSIPRQPLRTHPIGASENLISSVERAVIGAEVLATTEAVWSTMSMR